MRRAALTRTHVLLPLRTFTTPVLTTYTTIRPTRRDNIDVSCRRTQFINRRGGIYYFLPNQTRLHLHRHISPFVVHPCLACTSQPQSERAFRFIPTYIQPLPLLLLVDHDLKDKAHQMLGGVSASTSGPRVRVQILIVESV